MKNVGFAIVAAGLLAGCAGTPTKYGWGNYENSLYQYYKDPSKAAELASVLQETIQGAEQSQKPVPPGIYAEYGYMLMQQGKSKDALPFFEKEKAKWPESTYLMDSLIQMSSTNAKQPSSSK
jgi:hypothetical protein